MSDKHKLSKKIFIQGKIVALTGLMIGGSSSAFEIGGVDKTIIRHPITKLPYIPGSSLKGKMRSLLELHLGTTEDGGATQNPDHTAAQLFGHIKSRKEGVKKAQQPSRVLVRDGYLDNPEYFDKTELLYTEIKAENSIDRITSEANPRFFERVPSDAIFILDIVLNVFEGEEKRNLLLYLLQSLQLVQDDYLGAAGSRGNGQIDIQIISIAEHIYDSNGNGKTINDISNIIPKELLAPIPK